MCSRTTSFMSQCRHRSSKLLEWGLKVVPADAPAPLVLEGDTPKLDGGGNGEDR
jgi:hypothetical protein